MKMSNNQAFVDLNQEAPRRLFSDLMQAWGLSALGNPQRQYITSGDESFSPESLAQTHLRLNLQLQVASPRARLTALKSVHFPQEGKAERIRRSLESIRKPFGINLAPAEWALIIQEEEEDED